MVPIGKAVIEGACFYRIVPSRAGKHNHDSDDVRPALMAMFDFFKPPRTMRQIQGQAGEDRALAFLLDQGLMLVERNFRCKGGEIDLVMHERAALVFIEVRKRGAASHGGAAASVTARKQARLVIAAQVFLQRYKMPPACRFDVIAIDGDKMDWLKNAFDAN